MTRPPKLCPMNMTFAAKKCYSMCKHTVFDIECASRTMCGPHSMSSKFTIVFAWSLILAVDIVCGCVMLDLYP